MGDETQGAEWWTTYFDRDFFRLYRPFLPAEETRREAEGALAMLGLDPGSRLLDLACGWGRHAREFARAGLRVTGLDLSAELLRLARREEAKRRGRARVHWVRADMRHLPFREGFDAVASLFSSLGYFGSDDADLEVLRGVRAALRPGGALLLEVMHRDQVAREFVERDWWEGEDGALVWVEREFDAVSGVSRECLRWQGEGGGGEKHHAIRVRTATEWKALLEAAGLIPERWYGDWDLSDFEHRSERLIVLARRAD
jgi:cyclopropane fatty-acyl-phospholipid synthase-like methyltransferase